MRIQRQVTLDYQITSFTLARYPARKQVSLPIPGAIRLRRLAAGSWLKVLLPLAGTVLEMTRWMMRGERVRMAGRPKEKRL